MPGTNLTRDEAATRASLLDVTSYAIDLDLTTSDVTFGSTTTIVFTCREPGASTFADLVGATIHEITLNGEPVDGSAYADNRIALSGLAADNTLVVKADCTYSRTGEGLHRFVDPADDRVYLYTQFEVPDARRVYTTFEQPDLKAPYTFTVTTPAGWAVSSNAATPEPEDAATTASRSGGSPRPSRCRPTSPRWSPASTTRSTRPTPARTARSRWGSTAASRWSSTSTPTSSGRSPRRASASSRRSSATPTRSGSTTSCSCRSTTWARWRTPGASPSATSTSPAAARTARSTSSAPR